MEIFSHNMFMYSVHVCWLQSIIMIMIMITITQKFSLGLQLHWMCNRSHNMIIISPNPAAATVDWVNGIAAYFSMIPCIVHVHWYKIGFFDVGKTRPLLTLECKGVFPVPGERVGLTFFQYYWAAVTTSSIYPQVLFLIYIHDCICTKINGNSKFWMKKQSLFAECVIDMYLDRQYMYMYLQFRMAKFTMKSTN